MCKTALSRKPTPEGETNGKLLNVTHTTKMTTSPTCVSISLSIYRNECIPFFIRNVTFQLKLETINHKIAIHR